MKNALNDYLSGRPVNLGGFTSAVTTVMGGGVPNVPPIQGDGTQVMPAMGGAAHIAQGVNHGSLNYRDTESAPKKSHTALDCRPHRGARRRCSRCFRPDAVQVAPVNAVPNVVNMAQEQAEEAIRSAGFEVGNVSTAKSDSVQEGHVISQDPGAGSHREEGTRVNLVISGGEDTFALPDVVDEKEETARRHARADGG